MHPSFLKFTPNSNVSAVFGENVNYFYCRALSYILMWKMDDKHIVFQRPALQFLLPPLVLFRLNATANLRLRQAHPVSTLNLSWYVAGAFYW